MIRKLYSSTVARILWLLVLLINTLSVSAESPVHPPKSGKTLVPEEQQRYLMYTFYNAGYDGDPNFNWTSIETALKNGFNGVMLAVPWDQLQPTRNNPPNWAILDKQIARITELGGKVGLLIGVQRDLDKVDSFWGPDEFARTYKNEVLYKAHAFQFSPAHQPTVALATDFVKQVAQRYNTQQQQGNILFISVANSPIMEQEYSSTSQVLYQAGENPSVIDYSKPMIAGFRTWLTAKYTTITALNVSWGRNYANFNEVQPPGLYAGEIYDAFIGKAGKDWYTYRHKVHKALVDQTTQAIKSVNSTYKVINQHGSVFDNFSLFRGTLGFKDYALNTDGVKVNDAPDYLHRFSMDLLRSNLGAGKWVMNEIDGIGYARVGLNTYLEQIKQSFDHGAKVVTVSNFADAGGIEYARQIVQHVRSQGWLDQPVPEFSPNGSISVKLSKLVETGYNQLSIPSQWIQIYNQNGNRPVRITIDEDILDNTPVTTTPPTSTTATPTTPVSSLSLLAPLVDCATGSLTFVTAGGDGKSIDYMAVGLKGWSPTATAFIEPYQRIGVTFVLKARQSGKEVTYSYTTDCSSSPTVPANRPPVLVTPVANQTAVLTQAYNAVIPATTFTDPDGQIVSWAISNLPGGLTFDPVTRVISGTASTIGTYTVTLVVTDNGGATAQTTFSIKAIGTAKPITPPVSTTTTPTSPLSLLAPNLDCTLGTLTFKTAGGDGTPVEYMAVGLKAWNNSPTTIIDPHQRTGVTFTLKARQSGREATYEYTTNCANLPPVVATLIPAQTITQGTSYSFVIPTTAFTDSDGDIVTWAVTFLPPGLTYNAATRTISGTPTAAGSTQAQLTVTDNGGASAQQTIAFVIVTPVTTTPIVSELAMIAPGYDCLTGKLIFKTTGGDGTPIDYFAVGIKPWNRDSVATVESWLRKGVTFTLQARQSGKQVSYTFTTSCVSTSIANIAPVVVTAITNQTATLARSFSFAVPAATFSDADGQLVSWTAENLPVGLTFDATTHIISGTPSLIGPNLVTITVTDNAGASAQATFILQVLGNNSTPVTPPALGLAPLTLIAPDFDCVTGRLVFRSKGGDGAPVEYFAVGIKSWGQDTVGSIDSWQRDGVTFLLQARQSGKQVSYTFTTSCASPAKPTTPIVTTPVTTTPVATTPPVVVKSITNQTATLASSFSFVVPASTFSGADGQQVTWSAENLPPGLTFDAATHTISGVPTSLGSTFVNIIVTNNAGVSARAVFVVQVLGNSNPTPVVPTPPVTPTTPVTPQTPGLFALVAPAYDCVTGKLIFRSSGGDGTPVEYMALGIKSWSRDSTGTIDSWQRSGVTFTLQGRQSGRELRYVFTTTCGTVTTPVASTTAPVTTPAPTTSTLAIASPQNRIVYQRNQANQGSVPVIGQAPATATRVEARLVPIADGQGALLDWTNLTLSDAKMFTSKLTHTGGWYRLEVRAWNGGTQLGQQVIDRVGIGEVFIIAGQSNAYGGFEVRPAASDDRVSCVDYLDDNMYEASLPIRFSHMDISVTVGPNNPKHIWAELGDKLTSRLNVPVLFIGAAQPGSSSAMWRQSAQGADIASPDFFPYRRLGATLLHYIARTGARAVLWHQGEGDQGTGTQTYMDNLMTVINKSRQQTGNGPLPWVMSRATYVRGLTDPNIINAQNRLITEASQVFPGPETDALGSGFRLPDDVHIAGPGATRFVELWDQSLNADFFNRSAPFSVNESPQITTGYVLAGNRQAGQPIAVPYVVSGNPDATSSFSVQLIRDADGSVAATLGSGRENPMTVTLPANLANGTYRAKVVSGNLIASAGEPFRVGPSAGRIASPETEAGNWQAWPNPVEHELTVSHPAVATSTKLRVVLTNLNGLEQVGAVESKRIENGQLHLKLSTLQTGLYFLRIYDGEQPLHTLKVFRK